MKTDFRIDYISQTAAHYTTFPQTPQSAKVIAANVSDLSDRARSVREEIGNRALEKALAGMMKGAGISIRV